MNDDLTLLASAYLDGDTTPAERAQVDGDPTALAEVERLRRVRAVLRKNDGAPISTRERHLAAAFEVWDRMPTSEFSGDATPASAQSAAAAGQASITSPTSLGERRQRRGSSRLLTLAAGLVVVVGGGIVAREFISSNNSDDNIASEAADSADQDLSLRAELEVEAADERFSEEGDVSADELSTADVPAAPDADTLIGGESEGPPDEEFEVLSSVEELAVFANDLNRTTPQTEAASDDVAAEPAAASDATADENTQAAPTDTLPSPFPLCGLVTRIVGPAFWEAGLLDEPVIVGIDDNTGDAVAYLPDSCTVIARTPLP